MFFNNPSPSYLITLEGSLKKDGGKFPIRHENAENDSIVSFSENPQAFHRFDQTKPQKHRQTDRYRIFLISVDAIKINLFLSYLDTPYNKQVV